MSAICKIALFFTIIFFCNTVVFAQTKATNKEILKQEIMEVEKNFNQDLITTGVAFAFEKYADDNAVIKRGNDSLIYGKPGIKQFYDKPFYKNAKAEWKPDFVKVSDDGTLAYTYGKYVWTMTNDKGEVTHYHGIFHTVWKRDNNKE